MSIRFILYAIFCCIVAGLLAVCFYVYREGNSPLPLAIDQYTIKPGQALSDVAHEMEQHGIISDKFVLIVWAKFKGVERQVQAGEYQFEAGNNTLDLLQRIVTGKVIEYSITFIEGWRFRQLLASLHSHDKLNHTLAEQSPEQIMQLLEVSDESPEGLFYPDTYRFPKGELDVNVLRQAYVRMQLILEKNWQTRMPGGELNSAYEALILASIVEKETGQRDERPTIAGVFLNRLKIRMRLQSDPTVIYGLGEKFNGNITRDHLSTDTAYNSYTRYGLPPTPIAMPGEASIRAVLHPAKTSAIYFVAKGDGSHEFSETLEQHNQAVARFQINRDIDNYRSSPLPGVDGKSRTDSVQR